jgi:hypothetical protein
VLVYRMTGGGGGVVGGVTRWQMSKTSRFKIRFCLRRGGRADGGRADVARRRDALRVARRRHFERAVDDVVSNLFALVNLVRLR